jgi:hypothetical protein
MCSARPVSRRTSIRRVGSLPRMRDNIMRRLATCGVAAVLCAFAPGSPRNPSELADDGGFARRVTLTCWFSSLRMRIRALRKARELAGGVGSYREDHVGATAVQVVRASRPGSRALSISARCTSGNWSR